MTDRARLQRRIGYHFSDANLLTLALSHRSYSGPNNERLEFLGDAILGSVIADYLYSNYPATREGDLSRMRSSLVRAEALAKVASQLDLGPDLLLGSGELKSGGSRRQSILGDTVEALIGAVYLDSDFATAKDCVLRWFAPMLATVLESTPMKDAKTALQEWLQQRGKPLPVYELTHTGGEAHRRVFTVSCRLDDHPQVVTGSASSRRHAEQQVAEKLLNYLEQNL